MGFRPHLTELRQSLNLHNDANTQVYELQILTSRKRHTQCTRNPTNH